MLESVHCPTCSTRYGLRAPRVRADIRRARCFRCASVFDIEHAVQRLLEPTVPLAAETGIGPEDLLDPSPTLEPVPPPAQEASLHPAFPEESTPSLTLGDLEGAEENILEKTLITGPEAMAEASSPYQAPIVPEDPFEATEGGYSSAKDAIAKLLGNMPAQEHSQERRNLSRPTTQMDVEATLDALESTLGGVNTRDLGSQPALPASDLNATELEPTKPMASTMKLTHDEIMSAMKAAALPIPTSVPKPISAPKPPPPPALQPIREAAPEGEASLLKVQVGQDIYNNISMDQITTWIEQGRVQDFHMVARQFSENWIEAGKVPSLRPVFERIRRQQAPAAQQAQAVILPPPHETAPIKKSLFGGLFNRG